MNTDIPQLPKEVAGFLREADVIRLGTCDAKANPNVAPFWFMFDGSAIAISTLPNTTSRNVRAEPRVCVLVDLGDAFDTYKGATLRGRATLFSAADAPVSMLSAVARIEESHGAERATETYRRYGAIAKAHREPVYIWIDQLQVLHWWSSALLKH